MHSDAFWQNLSGIETFRSWLEIQDFRTYSSAGPATHNIFLFRDQYFEFAAKNMVKSKLFEVKKLSQDEVVDSGF